MNCCHSCNVRGCENSEIDGSGKPRGRGAFFPYFSHARLERSIFNLYASEQIQEKTSARLGPIVDLSWPPSDSQAQQPPPQALRSYTRLCACHASSRKSSRTSQANHQAKAGRNQTLVGLRVPSISLASLRLEIVSPREKGFHLF